MSSSILKLDDLAMSQSNKDVTINGQRDGLEQGRGKAAVSIAGTGTFTLTAAQSRWGVLELTGVLTGNRTVEVPTGFDHSLVVVNNTTGAFTVDFKWNGGTALRIPRGCAVPIRKNGGAAAYDHRDMVRLPEVIAYRDTSTQSVTNATDTVVVFNAEALDNSESFNTSTGVFTAPAAGLYKVDAAVEIDVSGILAGSLDFHCAIRVNSTVVRRGNQAGGSTASGNTRRGVVSGLLVLAQGDTVDIIAREELTGGTVVVDFGIEKTYFQLHTIRLA